MVAEPVEVDLLVAGGTVVTMDSDRRVLMSHVVAIKNGRIVGIVPTAEAQARYRANRSVDAGGALVLPGLVDVHLHFSQQLSRGLGDDVALVSWFYDRIAPYEAVLDERDVEIAALLSCVEMIRTGTTCASDPGGYHVDGIGRAIEASGMRGIVAWGGMDQWSPDRPLPEGLPGKLSTEQTLETMEGVVQRWHGAAGGRIRAAYGLRTEPNVTAELFQSAKALADRDGTFIHIHIAVTAEQVAWMRERVGATSIEYLSRLGVLDRNWLMAHAVAISDKEVELLAAADARIAHQPGASAHGCYGASSIGRIPELLAAGVTVGLGCDANSANNSLDMFRSMNLAATLHKEARRDPTLVSPEKALEMATVDAARAIGWDDEIGSLEVGKAADLAIVETTGAHWVPLHDFSLIPTLVYSGDGYDVRTTIVDGVPVMEDRELLTLDVPAVLEEAQGRARSIVERLPYRLRPRWPITGAEPA